MWFTSLSQEDINYAKAWDRYRKLKEDYAALCARDKTQLTWLEGVTHAQQLAQVLNKALFFVSLPCKNSPNYQAISQFLKSKELCALVGDQAVCVFIQPKDGGGWSPRNEVFIRGYGGGKGDIADHRTMFTLERGRNQATIFPSEKAVADGVMEFFKKLYPSESKSRGIS